ncbi:hypothetical protein Gogos_021822 [Gossypium gossypioides]|uniref:Uncharacterized protein n=1 Tax=Gossypium gossypioides TaxID=34282 RepID=A0A7J9D6Q8_GOSGO|nr:hypothetical protein [Gossypium gossypioides]
MFTISKPKNKFTSVGCDTCATIMAEYEVSFNDFQILMSAKIQASIIVFLKGIALIRWEIILVHLESLSGYGDGRKDGTGCIPNVVNVIRISTVTSLSVLVAIVGSLWLFFIRKKRKLFNMKKKILLEKWWFTVTARAK